MKYETIDYQKEKNVAIIKINREKALNALNQQVLGELDLVVDRIEQDPDVRVVIITGAGEKSFVAGADIKEMQNYSPEQALEMAQKGQSVFSKIEGLSVPVIAAVNGFALGGGMELALCCDVVFASDRAKFGLPEVSLGLIPGYGGTQRLSRCVGEKQAKYMIFSGEMFKAEKLLAFGMVSEIFPHEELLEQTMVKAIGIATRAPRALEFAKKCIRKGADEKLEIGLQMEAKSFSQTFSTNDKTEGIGAFLEKRQPLFCGN